MTSSSHTSTRHLVPSTTSMFPAIMRPCCKGRLLSKIGGAVCVAVVLYFCLVLQQSSDTETSSRQLRDTGISNSGSAEKAAFRGNSKITTEQARDFISENFKELSQKLFVKTKAGNDTDYFTAYFNSRLQREVSAMRDGLALHRKEMARFPCSRFVSARSKNVSSNFKVTIVYSLVGVDSIADAVLFMRNNFEKLPTGFVDDIIVTVEEEAEAEYKTEVEEVLDLCGVCRVFFFSGTIWEHRNSAANFARGEILVFVDARVHPLTEDWVRSLVQAVTSSPKLVVSPNVRLRGGDQGRDLSVGVSRNEITWSLSVARGPISDSEISYAIKSSVIIKGDLTGHKDLTIEQTAVAKEVFAIRKSFFTYLGGFDVEKAHTGGEHVLFSLKVLTCGGNIVLSLCSDVALEIASTLPLKPTYLRNLTQLEKSLPPVRQKRLLDSLRFVSNAEFLGRQAIFTVDFQNPSFMGQVYSTSVFFNAGQDVWMDSYSRKYSGCSVQPRIYGRSRVSKQRAVVDQSRRDAFRNFNRIPGRAAPALGVRLKQQISSRKCATRNFRAIISKRQVRMVSPSRRATFYGYIRSADGLYAFGLSPAMSEDAILALASSKPIVPDVASGNSNRVGPGGVPFNTSNSSPDIDTRLNIVLTRNSSEWIGPFSHTNGAFIYQHSLCITRLPSNNLTLRKCVKGTREQLFVFSSHTIKPAGSTDEWMCAKLHRPNAGTATPSQSLMVSGPVFLARCVGEGQGSVFTQFKLDVRFKENCVA
ncbi:polypeptide N-acetylgalactosaminyltransferase [Elysia marginata]|uniref:Polypeptide N-acetylgalactosaminyltransferase n=1 Tax=Elysia marginata TaxID=1093978 RepID=A0AAV4EJR3_9GAST|nr:polypeptide N-acetylgalactosaminyltransferase [Elysia marginata]